VKRASLPAGLKRPIVLAVVAVSLVVVQAILVRIMAHGHIAHALLGAGNGGPQIGAAVLAAMLVIVRFFAILVAPGLLFAAAADVLAYVLVGPPGARRTSQGTGSSVGAGSSLADGAGTSIGGRVVE
jgi:hypothetical protein